MGGGCFPFPLRGDICHICSKIHQSQALSPSKKPLCSIHLPCLACDANTSQPLAPSSTPFREDSGLWSRSLFPSSPFLWWIHRSPTLEPGVSLRLAEGGRPHVPVARRALMVRVKFGSLADLKSGGQRGGKGDK